VLKVAAMKLIASLFAALFLSAAVHAGQASAVSADDAHKAVTQAAFVVDVRPAAAFAQGHLPQAVSLPTDAAQLPLADLARLLSNAGIDSSRTILIVGEAGDVNAQALWQRLGAVASGRVLWLVGGVQEWQMTGRSLSFEAATHKAIPQFLTPFAAQSSASRMAGSRVRSSELLERNLAFKTAAL
jgi:3-mercaptopyruvate sulfurtransferase SseA